MVHHGQSRGSPVATASRVRSSPPLSVESPSRRPSDPSSRPRAAEDPAATANPAPAAGGKPFLQAMPTVTEEAPPPLRAVQMEDVAMLAWDCLNRDDDDEELLRLLGNQTPLRDCHAFLDIGDITCAETLDPEESREPKRRRVLEYPSEVNQPDGRDHEMGSNFVTSEVTETSLICTDEPQSLNWDMQQDSDILDMISSLSYGAPYEPSDNQLENYSDGATVYYTPDQMTPSQESVTYMDYQTDMPGSSEIAPATENIIMQETSKLSVLKVSKGGSSMIKMKQNLTTFMTCPFTLIKPYWEEGNITLKDINQLIHAPPKQPPEILGMSAFSGKPVIGKTRIRTEGGKGSITILRTKG
ncbi:protein XRI1-like isoform X1 [Hordeum vulgare subsp. vulgare]|uniref:Protein XRI1 n=1 Tax=Hordeum vulgare subsp. vulgare TaxID=112509 RepID=A0A8I6Y1T0_HORVV|nr:protein XRI1-like isoform X1 [Hordeum vulgare subsp. vulgare]